MTESDLASRLKTCFSIVFPTLSDGEIPHSSVATVGNWDSLATVTLVAVVEEEFGIQVVPEAVGDFQSFDLVLDYLAREREATHVP
jgi:acyl carrier protein